MLNKSIGLHFGHDASICILEHNNINFLSQERRTRIKHAIGLNSDEIISLIQSHKFEKIDISSTQHLPIFYDYSKLIFELEDSESIDSDIFFKNLDKNHHYNKFNKWHPSDLSNYRGIFVAENKFLIKKQEEDSKTQYSLPGFSFNKIFSFYPKKKAS
jgi:predicted NodU family carbamoyl transferase